MKYKLIYAERAVKDLNETADYIAADNVDRAITFIQELKAAIEVLTDFPNSGVKPRNYALADKRLKVLIIKNYVAIYLANSDTRTITIYRIRNAAQLHGIIDI